MNNNAQAIRAAPGDGQAQKSMLPSEFDHLDKSIDSVERLVGALSYLLLTSEALGRASSKVRESQLLNALDLAERAHRHLARLAPHGKP